MSTSYRSEIHRFGAPAEIRDLHIDEAVALVRDGDAIAVLLDVVQPEQLDTWWADPAYPEVIPHRSLSGVANTGVAVGPMQFLENEKLVVGLADYFAYAGRFNGQLRNTAFARLIHDALHIDTVQVGTWAEFPLTSKREFQPKKEGIYSVPPHCDAIHFSRDPGNWPIGENYSELKNQISVFLSVADSNEGTGLVFWDYRPQDFTQLHTLMAEFFANQSIPQLEDVPKLVVRGKPGQLHVLNTRVMHAVEQCQAVRRTIGAFLVRHEDSWRMFH
ncbi:hypothetical protein [Ralstonia insidiosa]|uniref:hypothetical protein n=1 Tax=Ralstonia insidiosa TaxID=190721 RepID=UPI000CEE7597|nr:hypothetical protein [Ralstonia insidiosa]